MSCIACSTGLHCGLCRDCTLCGGELEEIPTRAFAGSNGQDKDKPQPAPEPPTPQPEIPGADPTTPKKN